MQASEPQQFIAGTWRSGRGQTSFPITNPATGEVLATYRAAASEDIEEALRVAERGFQKWRCVGAHERADTLRRGAQLLRERSGGLAMVLTLEQGKPLTEASREIEQAAQMLEWFAEEGRRILGTTLAGRTPELRLQTVLHPIGPVAAFTPWNFPVMLSAIKVGAALAAGCSVILKPAEETPGASAGLVRCLHDAGAPADALQLLVGDPARLSSMLISSPVIRKVSFTGSPGVGRLIGELAGRNLKPVTLELGGHAPVIVCDDADVQAAVATLTQIKFRNAGQICANPSRFFVHRSRVEPFIEGFCEFARDIKVGDGREAATNMGPLANARRLQSVSRLFDDALSKGAGYCQGTAPAETGGFFFAPSVLWNVSDEALVMQEEPFGPLVPIVEFDTLDEAISRANRLPLGLAAYGFTQGILTARRISEELNCGSVGINSVALMQPEIPFGGVMESGYGRENGAEGIRAYLSTRAVVTAA